MTSVDRIRANADRVMAFRNDTPVAGTLTVVHETASNVLWLLKENVRLTAITSDILKTGI